MTIETFVLDENGNPTPEPDFSKWCRFLGMTDRYIARDEVGNSMVSTVFIGCGQTLFETAIFGGSWHGRGNRYATRIEAIAGHAGFVVGLRALAKAADA